MKPIDKNFGEDEFGWKLRLADELNGSTLLEGPYVVTHDYTMNVLDRIDSLQVDAAMAVVTITLPPPTGSRRRRIIKTDTSTNEVTISAGTNLFIGIAVSSIKLRAVGHYLEVEPTGTGWLIVGTGFTRVGGNFSLYLGIPSLATNATSGFLHIPACAGTPTGTPGLQTGFCPIVVDNTNNKLYFYSSGAWRDAGP